MSGRVAEEGRNTDAPVEDIYWDVMRLRPSFPGATTLRIRSNWRETNPPHGRVARIWAQQLTGVKTVLDVGAGDKYWGQVLPRLGVDATYKTADTETHYHHDYDDFLAVEESFDVVLMLELLEHLSLDLGIAFIRHAAAMSQPRLGAGDRDAKPRHAYQDQVWNADFTHIRPWPAHDIWSVARISGFEDVVVYRQQLTSPRRRLLMPLQTVLSKVLDLDPAYGLLVFARKPR